MLKQFIASSLIGVIIEYFSSTSRAGDANLSEWPRDSSWKVAWWSPQPTCYGVETRNGVAKFVQRQE